MSFYQHEAVYVGKVVKQDLINAQQKHEGTEYTIPRLVLTFEVLSKLSDPRKPYDLGLRQPVPEGESKLKSVNINFWTIPDEKLQEMTAKSVEILDARSEDGKVGNIPDTATPRDFKNNEDGSAPNVNLVGKEYFLKVTVKEYNDKPSTFFNLHRYNFDAPKPQVVASDDVIKNFTRTSMGTFTDARKKVREERNQKINDKKKVPVTVGNPEEIPF